MLTDKNECLKRWSALSSWSQAANDQLSHVLQQLEGQKPAAQELAHLLSEADEVQAQCDAQLTLCGDLDQLSRSCRTSLKQSTGLSNNDPCTVANFVGQVEKQIGRVRQLVTNRTNEIRQLDEKWSHFEDQRDGLVQQLGDVRASIDGLSAKENSLQGIQALLPTIESLLDRTKKLETDKESLHKAGKFLTQLSQATLGSVQNKLGLVDNEFEAVHRTLLDLQSQFIDIQSLWKELHDGQQPIDAVINDVRRVCQEFQDAHPQDVDDVVQMATRCRKSMDQLRKCRAPLDSLAIKRAHLHDKLDTIPGFNTQSMRCEMENVQGEWARIQSILAGRIQTLDMQQVVLRQLMSLKDDILNWTSDSKETLNEILLQPTDLDLMELKLRKVQQEMPNYENIRQSIQVKMEQLSELNDGHNLGSVDSLQELVDQELEQVSPLLCNQSLIQLPNIWYLIRS